MKYNTEYHGVIDLQNVTSEDFKLMTNLDLDKYRNEDRYMTVFPLNDEDFGYDGYWKDKYKVGE